MNSLFGKYLFSALLAIAVGLSYVVRASFDNSLHGSIAAIIISLICLSMYAVVAWRSTALSHNPDNLYYMGLLFTLASLIYSLITLFLLDSNETNINERTYNLIGSFGIALISTFAGILYRILLLQKFDSAEQTSGQGTSLHQGPPPAEQPKPFPHVDLAEAAFKLRMELTQTIADMSVFRKTIIQAASETVQDTDKARITMFQQTEKATNEQTKILSTLATTMVNELTTKINKVADSIANVQKPLDELVTQQTQQIQHSTTLAEQSAGKLEHSIHNSSEKIINSGEKMETVFNSVLQSLQNIVLNLESTGKSISTLSSDIQRSMSLFSSVEGEIEQATKNLTTASRSFSESISQAAEVTPKYTQQFEQLITTLRQEAEQWQSMTQDVRTSLVQAVKKLTDVVKAG